MKGDGITNSQKKRRYKPSLSDWCHLPYVIYDNINKLDGQKTLVEIFHEGVVDAVLAVNIIRKQFDNVDAAITFATEDQGLLKHSRFIVNSNLQWNR